MNDVSENRNLKPSARKKSFTDKLSHVSKKFSESHWLWFWKGLPVFSRAVAMFRVRPYTMTSPARCRSLWDSCKLVLNRNVLGSFVECGVWKGGSSGIMALAIQDAGQDRELHLFDSFEGLPEPTEKDGNLAASYSGGRAEGKLSTINECVAGVNEVRRFILGKLKMPEKRVHFHAGWFQDTVPVDAGKIGPIALLRLDGDWYDSTKVCLEHFYPLLSPGGIVILDDYFAWEGCRNATDEYRAANNIQSPIQRIDEAAMFWVKT